MMIDAGTSILRQQYPNGCHIYDARGRLLRMVIACNPETGEVIRYQCKGETVATNADGSPRKRHGFWPAPLRVVPLGGPAPAGVPYRVGDGAREKRIDITAAEIIARARAKEQRVEIINRITAATGKTVTRKLTVADLDELIDKVEDGAREQRVGITAAEIIARARAKEQRVDFAEAPRPAEHEAFKGATERVNKLMAGLALPDEPPEQRAAIDAIEESIRPMLKRGEWLDAWRGIDR